MTFSFGFKFHVDEQRRSALSVPGNDGSTLTHETVTNSHLEGTGGSDREPEISHHTTTESGSFVEPPRANMIPGYGMSNMFPDNDTPNMFPGEGMPDMSAACDGTTDPFLNYSNADVPYIPEINDIIPFSLFPSPHHQTILLQMADIAFGRNSIPECGFYRMQRNSYCHLVQSVREYSEMTYLVATILPQVKTSNKAFADDKLTPEIKDDWHRFQSFLALCMIQLVGAVNYSDPIRMNCSSIFQMDKGNHLSSSLAWLAEEVYKGVFMKKTIRSGPQAITQRNTPVSVSAHTLWSVLQSIPEKDLIKTTTPSIKVWKDGQNFQNFATGSRSWLGEETGRTMSKKAHQLLLQLAFVWNRAAMANQGRGSSFISIGMTTNFSPSHTFDSFNRDIQNVHVSSMDDPDWMSKTTLHSNPVPLPIVGQHASRMFGDMIKHAPHLRSALFDHVTRTGLAYREPWASRLVHGLNQLCYMSLYWDTGLSSRMHHSRPGFGSRPSYGRPGFGNSPRPGFGSRPPFGTRPGAEFGRGMGSGSVFGPSHGHFNRPNSHIHNPPFGGIGHHGPSQIGFGGMDNFGSSGMVDDMMQNFGSVGSIMSQAGNMMDDTDGMSIMSGFENDDLPDLAIETASDELDVFADFNKAMAKPGSLFKFL